MAAAGGLRLGAGRGDAGRGFPRRWPAAGGGGLDLGRSGNRAALGLESHGRRRRGDVSQSGPCIRAATTPAATASGWLPASAISRSASRSMRLRSRRSTATPRGTTCTPTGRRTIHSGTTGGRCRCKSNRPDIRNQEVDHDHRQSYPRERALRSGLGPRQLGRDREVLLPAQPGTAPHRGAPAGRRLGGGRRLEDALGRAPPDLVGRLQGRGPEDRVGARRAADGVLHALLHVAERRRGAVRARRPRADCLQGPPPECCCG